MTDTYDALPYPGHPFPQSHPGRMAAQAVLRGLAPSRVETARVLELGCGERATSSRWPSGYRGRRSSASTETLRRSLASQELAATLELTNIEFLAADLESFERPALTHVLRDGAAGTDPAHHLAASLARLADHALLVP